jgi:hypothetical protein
VTTVFVYLAEATFKGTCEFSWGSPEVGDRHKVMLFLSQSANEVDEAEASRELSRFGFADILLKAGKSISVESLNDPKMQQFQKHYEEALSEGSSVGWYPSVLPQHA